MPDTDPQSFEQRFEADGLDLVSSLDDGKPPRYPVLVNVRQIQRGQFRSRPALNALQTANGADTPWHSLRRLNDKPSGNFTHIAGVGTKLYVGASAAAGAAPGAIGAPNDTGYSGNPLSLVPFRPQDDIAEWMAVFDSNKTSKVKLGGTRHGLGIVQPTYPPDVGLDPTTGLQWLHMEEGTGFAGWGVSAPLGVVAANFARCNAQCTIDNVTGPGAVWGDGPGAGGGAGWLSLPVLPGPPSGLTGIGPGTILRDAGTSSDMAVEAVLPQTPAATTIKQIIFDPDGIGQTATITPTRSYEEFAPHAIIHGTHGASNFYGVIMSAVAGPDGTLALRVFFTTDATALVGGNVDALETRPTLYVYSWLTRNPTGALSSFGVKYAALNTVSTAFTLTKGLLALNLSAFTFGGTVDRALDEMHVSLLASDWNLADSVKIEVDWDDGTFAQNGAYHIVRQADLLALQRGQLGAIDTRSTIVRNNQLDQSTIVRKPNPRVGGGSGGDPRGGVRTDDARFGGTGGGTRQPGGVVVDEPGSSSSQSATGTNQWVEIRFKLSDFMANKYGTDLSKGLQKVNALRLTVNRNATAGVFDLVVGSWWIGGGSSPDVGLNAPYEYRYRWRSSLTGARSNWSPPGRSLVYPHRVPVRVRCVTLAPSGMGCANAPNEADKIDVQRRGGTVNDWTIIGTFDTGGSPAFTDNVDDAYALGAQEDALSLEGDVNDQPFTVQAAAFATTATTVAGTMVKSVGSFASFVNGSALSILQKGSGIIVNGIATAVYRVISADQLELFDNVGTGSNFKLEIPAPFLTSQPLPVVFEIADGWYGACGDPKNPGRLYVLAQNNLDSAPGNYFIDVTDPGDPLQNGCSFLGRGYLWSGNAMYVLSIDPSLPGAPVRFERLMSSVGMYSRYALAVGDAMYWLGKDGIYVSDGGTSHNITTGTLAKLFPTAQTDGADIIDPVDGVTVLLRAPSMAFANATADGTALHQFRLSYTYDKTLWFDYVDGTGARRSLGMMRAAGVGVMLANGAQEQWGWWYDTYANGVLFHYSAEGENVRQILCGGTSVPAKLYSMGASVNGDDGTAYACQVRTFAVSPSPRSRALFSDAFVDADPGTASLAVRLLFDNHATAAVPTASPLTGSGRPVTPVVLDLNSGRGVYSRNIGVDIKWSIAAVESPTLFRWGASVIVRPDETIQRSTDFTDCGFWGPKEMRGADIECMSTGVDGSGVATVTAKTLVFEYTQDDGSVASVAVPVSVREKSIVPIAFPATFIAYEVRIRPSDSNTWREFTIKQWHFDQLADLTALITKWDDLNGEQYVQGVELYADTNGVAVPITVQKDFAAVATPPFNITHPGRGWKSYSFPNPFVAYLLRIVPSGSARLMQWRWKARPEAPLGDVWEAQEIEIGDPYGFAQYVEVEYASTTGLTLKYTIDGTLVYTDTTTLTATGSTDPGSFQKMRVILPAVKGRLAKVRLESAAQFRLREGGTVLYRKSYGDDVGFRAMPIIGAQHGAGAEV